MTTKDNRRGDYFASHGVPTGFADALVLSDSDDNVRVAGGDPIVGIGLRLTAEGQVIIRDGNGQQRFVKCVNPPNDIPVAVRRVEITSTTIPVADIAVYVGER